MSVSIASVMRTQSHVKRPVAISATQHLNVNPPKGLMAELRAELAEEKDDGTTTAPN